MSLLQIENAKLCHGAQTLFENISFTINNKDRIGLVGNNGCGKSSLLHVITGGNTFDSGTISKQHGLNIGYVPQNIPEEIGTMTCTEFLRSKIAPHLHDENFWKVNVALAEIGLDESLWNEPVSTLSGGWRRLLLIASATLNNPTLLILDEPTNHLDLGKTIRLENWLLNTVAIPSLIVSHDRAFLDRCTNKTIFLRSDGAHEYKAPFSTARENLLQADALALKSREKEEIEIKRLERAAKRLKSWGAINPFSGLCSKGQSIQNRANKLKQKQTEVYTERKRDITLHQDTISSRTVALIHNVTITTPDSNQRKLFSIERLQIEPGDRICLLGLNGTGKSLFVQRLLHELRTYTPGPSNEKLFWFTPQLRLGYLDQHLSGLPEEKSIADHLATTYALDITRTTRELVTIGFPPKQQCTRIKDLSAGERARYALLTLRLDKPNFYILDEPTNHLDIQGQEALEDELDDKGHSCIFVSHDRHLVRTAATRYLEIKPTKSGGRLVEVPSPEPFLEELQKTGE